MKKRLFICLMGVVLLSGCGNISTILSKNSDRKATEDNQNKDEQKTEKESGVESESPVEIQSEESEPDQTVSEDVDWTNSLMKLAYMDTLMAYKNQSWSLLEVGELTSSWSEGQDATITYAMADIDSDGLDELIVDYDLGYMASMSEDVYYYDPETHKAVYVDTFFPYTTYYDNGLAVASISHNQGMAGDSVWPYTLWRFDTSSKSFIEVADVDGWDKSLGETDIYTGESFPADVDEDGDGYIYYVVEDGKTHTVDNSKYESWLSQTLGDANIIDLDYIDVTGEYDFSIFYKDFETQFMERTAELEANGNFDLAREYASLEAFTGQGNGFLYALKGIADMQDPEGFDIDYYAYINGEPYMHFFNMDGGEIYYLKAVDGITLLGLKPGDKVDEEYLKYYGFYKDDSNGTVSYKNGISYDGMRIGIETENGIITKLSFYQSSYFWG